MDKWWAEPESVMLCNDAQSVTAEAEVSVTGKDFQLAYEARISGTVYQDDGATPLTETGLSIQLVSGDPCGDGDTSPDSSDGTYSIAELTPGTYYLRASASEMRLSRKLSG